jgi:hypothetical protein
MESDALFRPRAALIWALLFCAYAALTSRFWTETYDALSHVRSDYTSLRTERSFDHTPVLPIAGRLDEILPRDVPVALAPSLESNEGLRQRLTESLYPRRVDRTAPHVLSLAADGSVRTPEPDPAHPVPAVRPPLERFDFDAVGLIVSLGALLGFGFAVVSFVPSLRGQLPAAVLAGCAAVGVLAYVATFLQAGVPWGFYRAAGWVALGYAAWRAKGRLASWRIAPEGWILVALLALLFVRMAVLPITGWDGRSVWLFHAKQLYVQKMMALYDLHHPDWEWAHPVYPFLAPGVMAMFGGGGGAFNERMAALAMPVAWGASLALLWGLLRGYAGRAVGAVLTVTLFFGLQAGAGELYMDGWVAVLLAVVVLSIASPERRALAVLAACVVSLVKIEGAVACGLILLGWAALEAVRGRRGAATAALLLPLVLPVAHRVWLSAHDVTEFQASLGVAKAIEAIPTRLPVFVSGVPQMLARDTSGQQKEAQALLRLGTAGLALGLTGLIWRRKRPPEFWRVLGGGALLAGLAIIETSGMPQDAAWLVTWTLDRLLIHPAVLFLLLPFL